MLPTTFKLETGEHFPPLEENPRINRIVRNRSLYSGDFNRLWGEDVIIDDRTIKMNWFRRITEFWVQGLFGAPPNFTDLDVSRAVYSQMVSIARLAQRDLHRFGNSVIAIQETEGRYHMETISPDSYYLIGDNGITGKQVTGRLIAFKYKTDLSLAVPNRVRFLVVPVDDAPTTLLEFQLDGASLGTRIRSELMPGRMHLIELGQMVDETSYGNSIYEDLEDSVRQLNTLNASMAAVFKRHANPHFYVDERVAEGINNAPSPDGKGGLKRNPQLDDGLILPMPTQTGFPEGANPVIPGYVTWDAKLESQFAQIEELESHILNIAALPDTLFVTARAGGSALSGQAFNLRTLPMQMQLEEYRRTWETAFADMLTVLIGRESDMQWPNLGLFNVLDQSLAEAAQIQSGIATADEARARLNRGE